MVWGLTGVVYAVVVCVQGASVGMVCARAYAVTRWLLSCGIHSQRKHALAVCLVDV